MFKKVIALAVTSVCLSVNAQSLDFSLSTGDWTSVDGQTLTGAQTFQAGPNAWAISPYTGSTMYSLSPTMPTNTYSNMSTALGLSSTSISALSAEIAAQNPSGGGSITNAAWVSKNFTFAAPATFKMYWTYTSVDYVPFNDGSITTLVNTGDATTLGKINGISTQYLLLGATNPGTGNYSTGSYGSTGWQVVNYDVTTAGTYKLGFAVFNQGDTALSPVLNVNDGIGTVTQNGTVFGSVAPNDPTMPTVDPTPTPTPTPTPPAAPTVVSQSTSDSVSASTTNGTATIATSIAYGATAVAVAQSNAKGEQTPKVLKVVQTTVTTGTTPFTLKHTTTTPVTTTTVTTPVVTKVWSDGTTTTENGTPVTSSTTTDSVSVVETPGVEVIEVDAKKDYSTRVDQYSYMKNANERINLTLDSDVLSRHEGLDDTLKSKTGLMGNEHDGWTYVNIEGQRSNVSDTYRMNTQRYGIGHEKNVLPHLLVGAQYNYVTANLTGDQAGGNLEKNHVGLYSLLNVEGWLLKSDLGVAVNTYKNYHTINELQLANQGKANGTDVWLANRLYTPSMAGFRPFAGVRVQNSQRNSLTEGGSEVSAMSYAKVNDTNTITEGGLRYDNTLFDTVNVTAEAGKASNDITTYKLGASFTPAQHVLGGVTLGQQRQNGVTNNIAQVTLKVLF
jgi:hypothetical protein